MKKIVTNALIVSGQLIVGGLFLFMLFSDDKIDSRVVVVDNNNLNKMADSVNELFVVDHAVVTDSVDENAVNEEELISAEEKKKQEEEAARIAAEEEAKRLAEEEAARIVAEEEKERIAQEEAEKAQAVINSSNNSVSALQNYAYDLVINTYGWSEADYNALVLLWNAESGWKVAAGNSSSGAYGIPQALPGNKMASAGSDWETNGETQIRWGLNYIQGRYGTPSAAYEFFQNNRHY